MYVWVHFQLDINPVDHEKEKQLVVWMKQNSHCFCWKSIFYYLQIIYPGVCIIGQVLEDWHCIAHVSVDKLAPMLGGIHSHKQ